MVRTTMPLLPIFDSLIRHAMKLILQLLFYFFLIGNAAVGQKQDHVWYFGPTGVGLDFGGCEPVVLMDGYPDDNAFEGATAVSDAATGDLLFYTTGHKSYNSLLVPMSNGDPVGLSNSLSQMVIVPWPDSPEKYFLVIPEVQAGISYVPLHPAAFSLYYAVIDMSLDGGLGDVASKFNVMMTTPHCEFLTAVPHSNGSDYWLIGHLFNSNSFFTYAVTGSGIATVPTIQNVGPVVATPQPGSPNSSNMDAVGSMRASPDGTRLAFTTAHNGITCVLDLDPSTGIISAPMDLTIPGGGYGVSFSPDGTKLFVSVRSPIMSGTYQEGSLVQFDLSSGDPNTVQASRNTLHQITGNGGFTTLKLGPDGRLYVCRVSSNGTSSGDPYVGVVNAPDLIGAACDYVHDGIWLNGAVGSWGLNNSIEYGHQCREDLAVHDSGCNDVVISTQNGLLTASWTCPGAFTWMSVKSMDGRSVLDEPVGKGKAEISWSMPSTASGLYIMTLWGAEHRVVRSFYHSP